MLRAFIVVSFFLLIAPAASAQQGYEFEVYGPEIGPKGSTELELSSNYVAKGLTESDEGVYPTNHAWRSSFEVSRTLNSWLQATAYLTTNARPEHSLSYVGNRVKLTMIVPESWNLPFDLGFANEIIYSRPGYAESRWAFEITPILSRTFGAVELVFNPALERGLSASAEHHIDLEPRGKIAYELPDHAELALEYYGGLGGIGESYAVAEQRHQIFGKVEAEVSPRTEAVFGIGRGLTRSSDAWVLTAAFELKFGN
jgi:hypothetical protein